MYSCRDKFRYFATSFSSSTIGRVYLIDGDGTDTRIISTLRTCDASKLDLKLRRSFLVTRFSRVSICGVQFPSGAYIFLAGSLSALHRNREKL